MSATIYTIVVRDMAHLTCAPSVLLFDNEAYAVHYIYTMLPTLIQAEVGCPVYIRACPVSPLFTKYHAKRLEDGRDVEVTISLTTQRIYSRSDT